MYRKDAPLRRRFRPQDVSVASEPIAPTAVPTPDASNRRRRSGLSTAYAVMHVFSLMVYDVPFSRENVKGEGTMNMWVVLMAMPVAGALSAVQAVPAKWIHVSIAATAARARSPPAKEFPL